MSARCFSSAWKTWEILRWTRVNPAQNEEYTDWRTRKWKVSVSASSANYPEKLRFPEVISSGVMWIRKEATVYSRRWPSTEKNTSRKIWKKKKTGTRQSVGRGEHFPASFKTDRLPTLFLLRKENQFFFSIGRISDGKVKAKKVSPPPSPPAAWTRIYRRGIRIEKSRPRARSHKCWQSNVNNVFETTPAEDLISFSDTRTFMGITSKNSWLYVAVPHKCFSERKNFITDGLGLCLLVVVPFIFFSSLECDESFLIHIRGVFKWIESREQKYVKLEPWHISSK